MVLPVAYDIPSTTIDGKWMRSAGWVGLEYRSWFCCRSFMSSVLRSLWMKKLYSSWRRGSNLSNMSAHTDDAGVSAASLLPLVVLMLDEDKRRELTEGGVDT